MKHLEQIRRDVAEQIKSHPDLYTGERALSYLGCALAGEAGEVADQVAKRMRGTATTFDSLHEMQLELGDVLWYLLAWCEVLGVSLEDLAAMNQEKLAARRGKSK